MFASAFNPPDLSVPNQFLTQRTRLCVNNAFAILNADQIQRCPFHIGSIGVDDGVRLSMHGLAHFVALSMRDVVGGSPASALVTAVGFVPRGTVVAGSNDDIILDNHSTVLAANACGTSGDGFSDTKEILTLLWSAHSAASSPQGS